MKKNFLKLLFLFLLFLAPSHFVKAMELAKQLSGKILLQVEENGEAWYINPADEKRYYLGRPSDAFRLMQNLGTGITNKNLEKIPVAEANWGGLDDDHDGLSNIIEDSLKTDKTKIDTDEDGFSDKEELLQGYNPRGKGKINIDINFSKQQRGKIFLQIESHGEAWYVNPDDNKRYFLGRPSDAFNVMRNLGLGITDKNLNKIILATSDNSALFKKIEREIHDLINKERISQGLQALIWNSKVAEVARIHSLNLAQENKTLTNIEKRCNFPIIHHEGYNFGIYQKERLDNKKIYNLSKSGENIALMPRIKQQKYIYYGDNNGYYDCGIKKLESVFREKLDTETDEAKKINIIKQEISKRENLLSNEPTVKFVDTIYNTEQELEAQTVNGWMNSPGHRKNILTPDFNETGIGIAEINNYLIITQVFIKKIDCGYKNGPCCIKEGYYPSCYIPFICKSNTCLSH